MRITFFLYFLIVRLAYSQDTLYYDHNAFPQPAKSDSSAYYSLISEHRNGEMWQGQRSYNILKYYLSGEVFSVGEYLDNPGHSKVGKFTFYYKNGKKQSEGRYEWGARKGVWKTWYDDGSLKNIIEYKKSIGPGIENYDVKAYYDSLGRALVSNENGPFIKYTDDGEIAEKGYVKKGSKAGEWKGYDKGKLIYKELYSNGDFVEGESYDSDGNVFPYNQLHINPLPKKGYPEFYKYIAKELRYPAEARRYGIQGKVFIQFVVDEEGGITDVKAVKGLGGGCNEEAIRVIGSAAPWSSPVSRGRKVKQRIILPVTFKLG